METTERFTALTRETAPPAAATLLRATASEFGFLPAPVARAAHSPAYLKHLLAGFGAFERSTLSELEREVVALTVAFEIECHYCMAMHSALLARMAEHGELVDALRSGRDLPSPRLQALREFTRALIALRGRVPEAAWQAFEREGFSKEQALDVLLGTGVYLLSTLGNVLTAAPLDAAFAAFAWQQPG